MSTSKLFNLDAYRTTFSAEVLACTGVGSTWEVELDQTLFYASAGGQPNDLGRLGTRSVLDVREEENGLIVHVVDGPLSGTVIGTIDGARRLDHMEQHTGQHLLSGTFVQLFAFETTSWHLGEERCTIDLYAESLTAEQAEQVENVCNQVIRSGLPVLTHLVDQAGLAALPLRKPPKVTEDIRVVEIQGYDWSACGGTHVRNVSEVGILKLKSWEKHKKGIRLEFLAGKRALRDYQRLDRLTLGLGRALSIGVDDLPSFMERSRDEAQGLRRLLKTYQEKLIEHEATELIANHAQRFGGMRVVRMALSGRPLEEARLLAAKVTAHPETVAILGTRGAIPQLMFQRSLDLRLDMGAIIRQVLPLIDGKGGGSPLQAQGSGSRPDQLEYALDQAVLKVVEAHKV